MLGFLCPKSLRFKLYNIYEMSNPYSFIEDFCLEHFGCRDTCMTDYIKEIARKANSLADLEKKLNDYDIPTEQPAHKHFANKLYGALGSQGSTERSRLPDLKRPSEYKLVGMDQPTKKIFIDQEVYKVKTDSRESAMEKDRRERDDFARRLL